MTKVASREERELFAAGLATDRVTSGMRMAWSADLGEDALAQLARRVLGQTYELRFASCSSGFICPTNAKLCASVGA